MKESNKKHPNVMFPLLLKRADCSSDEKRDRADGFIIDIDGNPVTDPCNEPERIALESDPNLNFEHFGEFWRKIHGERIIYRDGDDDNHCDGVCSYYQIQRVAAGPSSAFPPPYPVALDPDGTMAEHLHDKLPEYKRPSADGFVYWAAPALEDLMPVGSSRKQEKKISWDSLLFLRNFTGSLCAEYIILPSAEPGKVPPVCTVKVHYGKGSSQEEIQRRLIEEHSDFIMKGQLAQKLIKRFAYICNINKNEDEPFYNKSGVEIDAYSVTYFKDMADCDKYYASDEYRQVADRESEFIDTD